MAEAVDNGLIPGMVTGAPKFLLRLEGLALGCAAVTLYGYSNASWLLLTVLFLAPDLSLLAFLAGPRLGAGVYNAVHSTLLPILLGIAALPCPTRLRCTSP